MEFRINGQLAGNAVYDSEGKVIEMYYDEKDHTVVIDVPHRDHATRLPYDTFLRVCNGVVFQRELKDVDR